MAAEEWLTDRRSNNTPNMSPIRHYYLLICVLLIGFIPAESLHLKGSWSSSNFYLFLAKFGFQQTNMNDKVNTQGYIYGNITSKDNLTTGLTFVVLDSEYFLEFYGNRTLLPRSVACPAMFSKVATKAWDNPCNTNGIEDFLRHIPCPRGQLCIDEDNPDIVVPGYQFTYAVEDTAQPRFWYISMVACYHNSTEPSHCWWAHQNQDVIIDYDIWLVNGNPFTKHVNPFEHQFSFEYHDVFEVYLAFLVVYTVLVPIQIYTLSRQKHVLPLILTVTMCMEYTGIVFNFIHVFKFAFDGTGVSMLNVVGNFVDQAAQCVFMLLLLLIVKGWTITRMDLSSRAKLTLFTIWVTYTVANMALFIWNLMEIDLISDIDEWQTWPGYLILTFRLAIMIWFLLEMRDTFALERNKEKTRFYLHFGAGYLVWFVYLPILAVIATQVSPLWRHKTVLSVMFGADFISYLVLTHLLWPSRSYMYFNLKVEAQHHGLEELEFAGFPNDLELETASEDSIDIQETAALLKANKHQASSHDTEEEEVEEDDITAQPTTSYDDVTAHGDAFPSSTAHTAPHVHSTEPSDSGIESIANGESLVEHIEPRTRTQIVDLML